MNDNVAVALNLGFKGDRAYIQGGDIFNAINERVRSEDSGAFVSQLAFRDFCKKDCDLWWARPPTAIKVSGQGRASYGSEHRAFYIVESSREGVGRRPFDEDQITAPAVIDGPTIRLETRSVFTPIEEIIALTKALAYSISPDVRGKWVFGQLNLQRALPDEYGSLSIVQRNLIAGRFSVNEIATDSATIGAIRFIVGEP